MNELRLNKKYNFKINKGQKLLFWDRRKNASGLHMFYEI